jgi:hypothetical protein
MTISSKLWRKKKEQKAVTREDFCYSIFFVCRTYVNVHKHVTFYVANLNNDVN